MSRLINRDPFARVELHRENDRKDGTCSNCGTRGRLFHYFHVTDAGTRYDAPNMIGRDDNKRFCTVGCYREFHE